MTSGLRAVVVDDEPIAREGLSTLLRREPGVESVLSCGSRDESIALLQHTQPDVIFLDIQLSPGTGFEVAQHVRAPTQVVFVTAFDQHAVEAFRTAALDYIVKPVDPDRLRASLERARDRLRLIGAADQHTRRTPLVFSDGMRSLVFAVDELAWIEGADDYAELHARGRRWLVRETMDGLTRRLPTPPFHRVHRSAIVNIEHVMMLERSSRRRHVALLRDGVRVPISAARRPALDAALAARVR